MLVCTDYDTYPGTPILLAIVHLYNDLRRVVVTPRRGLDDYESVYQVEVA